VTETVLDVRPEPVVAGETVYVYGAGAVEAHGGRVVVGSGGRCLSRGDTRVSLVADGRGLLTRLPPARAVMVAGSLVADGGEVWAGAAVTCDLSGTARLVPLLDPEVAGSPRVTLRDGRRVEQLPPTDRDPAMIWEELEGGGPTPSPARHLDPEPADASAWVDPLTEELTALGAEVTTTTSRIGTDLLVRSRDPRRTLADLLGRVGVPPTLVVDQDTHGDWWLLSDYGVRARFTASGRAGRWPGLRR
jgi:hypothetical protein